MKLLLAALCLSFAIPAIAPAAAPALFEADRACACDPHAAKPDLFEEPIRFAFGPFRGQCVDACRFRRARVVEDGPRGLVVGNVLHLGKFVEARIRLGDVEGVQAGFERFAMGVDHVLLRFTFAHEVPLFAQDGSGQPVGTTRSIVISSEGVPPKGHKYNMTEGFWGHYLLGHRLVTGEELEHWVAKLHHPLRFTALQVRAASAARLLARGIRRSDTESFGSQYRLLSNNCSTSALSLLDAETGFRKQNWDPLHWEELEAALPIAGPFGTEHALGYRGLVSGAAPAVAEEASVAPRR